MITKDGKSVDLKNFKLPIEAVLEIKELHKIMTEGGNNRWNRAKFTVTPDGKFNMEFIWDQKLQDEYENA